MVMLRGTLCLSLLLAVIPAPALRAQARPTFDVGVRPARVRVGATFVLTVRLAGGTWPDVLDVEGLDGSEVVDVRDRSSTALGRRGTEQVLERDFVMRALRPGAVAPAGVFAAWGADTVRADVPSVEAVGSPVAWATPGAGPRRRPDDTPLRDQGVPPTAAGRDADRERAPQGLYPPYYGVPGTSPDRVGWPGTVPPVGGVLPGGAYDPYGRYPYPTSPYAPSGWGVAPPGQGWAPSAGGDPWWPELVPRVERYETAAQDPDGLVRLEVGTAPARVYQGQQVTLVATATFAPEALARLGSTPEFFPPSADDAWAVEIPYAPPTPAAVGGRVEEAHTFMRAFFPVSAGVLTIEPSRLTYGTGSGGSFARPGEELVTDALTVEVMEIPQRDAPPGWTGAVGRYRVAAWLQPRSVGWGEAALLTVEVAGAGNVRDLARPDPGQVWGAELRPTGERAYVEVRDGVVGGVKTFSWLVVPVEPGAMRIGPVIFSYFDPWLGAFGQVASEELLLESRPFPVDGRTTGLDQGGLVPHDDASAGGWTGAPYDAGPTGGAERAAEPTEPPKEPGASEGAAPRSRVAGGPAVLPGRGAAEDAGDAGASGIPGAESRAMALQERLADAPADGDAWLALASVYAAGRPGEGWAEWALLNGVRRAPRHDGLRAAMGARRDGGAPVPGVPRIPLTGAESLFLAGALGGLGMGLAALAAWRETSAAVRRRRFGVAAAVLSAAAVSLEPWIVLGRGEGVGVAVEGPVALRSAPSFSAEALASLASGTTVRLVDRYGTWVRVEGPEGTGWAEGAMVAPVGS